MIEAGVPCVPGYEGDQQEIEHLAEQAEKIGFPLMVKASAGGGGRGMRLVHQSADLLEALKTARSEAENAFGSGELIIEKAVIAPRHVEIQVFGDTHGNYIYLFERDCSIQRRHQKVVEEAPCPVMTSELRQKMGEAAVAAAKSCDYIGAGTVEFLLDQSGEFYFLEMNTRLQVEHLYCLHNYLAYKLKKLNCQLPTISFIFIFHRPNLYNTHSITAQIPLLTTTEYHTLSSAIPKK
jgi:geranyl-CoA carboxylase alpha subunit